MTKAPGFEPANCGISCLILLALTPTRYLTAMSRYINIVNQRFGRLIVIGRACAVVYANGLRVLRFKVRCDCGALKIVRGYHLRNGSVSSCGCLIRERAAALAESRTMHGDNRRGAVAPEYSAWRGIIVRCERPSSTPPSRSRRVRICKRWRDSYANFLADVGRRPSALHSIEHIDKKSPYQPGNVRWIKRRR